VSNSYKAVDFANAIPGTGGIISAIARKVGCDWHTAKKYIEAHASVKAVYDAECERVLDLAETVIIQSVIDDKDVQTAKWYLTLKGRDRGYSERREVDVTSGGQPIVLRWPDQEESD
jgi:hypothetical protein